MRKYIERRMNDWEREERGEMPRWYIEHVLFFGVWNGRVGQGRVGRAALLWGMGALDYTNAFDDRVV